MFDEWKNIAKHKFLIFVIIMISIIPAIYSNLFLDSMWKPYKSIENLPVAVINNDLPTKVNGKEISIGKDLVEKLKDKKTLDFHFIDNKEEAIKELKAGKYYMVLEINKDFSENAGKILGKNPKSMKLDYVINPGLNYISTKITDTAMKDIQKELIKSVQDTYISTIFDKMKSVSDSVDELKNGVVKLDDASVKLLDGQNKLGNGIGKLNDGATKLSDGSKNFSRAIDKYTNSVGLLKDGANKLDFNTPNLINGSNDLMNGIDYATSNLSEGIGKLSDGVNTLSTKLPTSNQISAVNNGIDKVAGGISKVKIGVDTLKGYTGTLDSGVSNLAQGSKALQDGIQNFAQSVSKSSSESQKVIEDFIKELIASAPVDKQLEFSMKAKKIKDGQDKQNEAFKLAIGNLNKGATELNSGLGKIQMLAKGINGTDDKSGVSGLSNGVNELSSIYNNMFVPNQKKLNNGYLDLSNAINNNLSNGVVALGNGVNQFRKEVSIGSEKLSNGIKTYTDGVDSLSTNLAKLYENSPKLIAGYDKIGKGIGSLSNGVNELKNGNVKLVDGLEKMNDGTSTMLEKMNDASDKAVNYSFERKNIDSLLSPIEVKREEVSTIVNNGHAMAPYMMTISLFVGALAVCMVYPLDRNKNTIKNAVVWWSSKFGLLLLFAVLQSVILCGSMLFFLGFSPIYTAKVFVVAFCTSIAFLSIISFLVVNYGIVGKFLTIVLLVLQLCTSEGTYPLVLSRSIYKTISPYLPATYSIKGLKEAISINGNIGKYITVLILIAIVFTIINVIVLSFYRRGKLIYREKIEKHIKSNMK